MKKFKIAYLGGGSKQWARTFMTDLALSEGLEGEIGLYDIDEPAAILNKKIGEQINKNPKAITKINYVVYSSLQDCLKDANFVVISILPGTFEEMTWWCFKSNAYGSYL